MSSPSVPSDPVTRDVLARLGNPNVRLAARWNAPPGWTTIHGMAVAATFELVGREDELARLEEFVSDLSAGAAGSGHPR